MYSLCMLQYERSTPNEEGETVTHYTPAERASHLGMRELAAYLLEKQQQQTQKIKNHQSLLPKRALQKHFEVKVKKGAPAIFITQHDFGRSKSFYW